MTITETDKTPRAWVGCLACYNEGNLVGRWIDDPDEMREYRCPRPVTIYNMHEELWCFDHENMNMFIDGECSPSTFADACEKVDELEAWQPVEAVAAWLSNIGESFDSCDLSGFEDSYRGEWASEQDYAENLADDCGLIDADAVWPNSYIDWERATRDLFMDGHWSAPAPGGGVFVFSD